jgi:hypothetical protein
MLALRNFRSRARRPVRPPPFWEFVNGSRDLLFRGVSSCSLSITNLLCGHEDLYFPSDVLSSVATIFSIYHFSIYSEMKLWYVSIFLKSFVMKKIDLFRLPPLCATLCSSKTAVEMNLQCLSPYIFQQLHSN